MDPALPSDAEIICALQSTSESSDVFVHAAKARTPEVSVSLAKYDCFSISDHRLSHVTARVGET